MREIELPVVAMYLVARRVLLQAQHIGPFLADLRADMHRAPHGPKSEQPDSVLALHEELVALFDREVTFARVADIRRDVRQRLLAAHFRENALAVVTNRQHLAPLADKSRDQDPTRRCVERVLYQLGHRLARVMLRARQQPNQVEGIGRAQAAGARGRIALVALPTRGLARLLAALLARCHREPCLA
jgi:hypothetical protein